jgi:hypothetical protein
MFFRGLMVMAPLTPPPPTVSTATGDTSEDGERETTRQERGKGVDEEPNHTTARKFGPLKIIQ